MEIKSYNEIYKDMKNYIIAHQDKITDFNEGGALTSQVEAFARELAMLYVNCRVGFTSFLRELPYSVFRFEQKEGKKASAYVVFSRSKSFPYDTTIPTDTVVEASGLKFTTVVTGTILADETDSAAIPVSAEEIGDKYNVGIGTIKTIKSVLPADIILVNNYTAATGGQNDEDWGNYLDRFTDYIFGLQRTNISGLKSVLVELIHSISMEEHFPPIDGLWNVTLYLEDGSGGMTPDALAEAKKIIDGVSAKEIGGFRAPGVNIRYKTPEIVPITTSIIITVKRDLYLKADDIKDMVIKEVQEFINRLKIGNPVLKSDLIVLLKRFSSLSNVQIQEDDIILSVSQIARYQECHLTVVTNE